MHAVEMTFERVDVRRPQSAKRRQPGVDLLKRLRFQAIQTPLRVDGGFDEAGLAQHPEMLRHRRLRHPKLTLDLPDRLFRGDQQAEDGPAVRLRDDLEDGFHVRYMPRMAYACQGT